MTYWWIREINSEFIFNSRFDSEFPKQKFNSIKLSLNAIQKTFRKSFFCIFFVNQQSSICYAYSLGDPIFSAKNGHTFFSTKTLPKSSPKSFEKSKMPKSPLYSKYHFLHLILQPKWNLHSLWFKMAYLLRSIFGEIFHFKKLKMSESVVLL